MGVRINRLIFCREVFRAGVPRCISQAIGPRSSVLALSPRQFWGVISNRKNSGGEFNVLADYLYDVYSSIAPNGRLSDGGEFSHDMSFGRVTFRITATDRAELTFTDPKPNNLWIFPLPYPQVHRSSTRQHSSNQLRHRHAHSCR